MANNGNSNAISTTGHAPPRVDLDALARKLVELMKREIKIERERMGKR